jgi:hypothetical protein
VTEAGAPVAALLPSWDLSLAERELRAFLAAETERTSAVSAHQHYRNLRVLFRWLAREGEREAPTWPRC